MEKDVILILGSGSDKDNANKVLKILNELGIDCRVAIASCHRHGGGEFAKFIRGIKENIIVFLGGMSLAAPGLIETILRKDNVFNKIVFAIPTDAAARSAIEDLPKGTAVITCGWNTISPTHSLVNSALAVARLVAITANKPRIFQQLKEWHFFNSAMNPLVPDLPLSEDGLIA